jgi:hypothetical protein
MVGQGRRGPAAPFSLPGGDLASRQGHRDGRQGPARLGLPRPHLRRPANDSNYKPTLARRQIDRRPGRIISSIQCVSEQGLRPRQTPDQYPVTQVRKVLEARHPDAVAERQRKEADRGFYTPTQHRPQASSVF